MTTINEKISTRREQLGLDDVTVANCAGLSIYAYGDVESYEHEASNCVDLRNLKKLCHCLQLDPLALFDRKCTFCQTPEAWSESYRDPRNALVRQARLRLAFTEAQLGDLVGYYGTAIEEVEGHSSGIETYSESFVSDLAAVTGIPWQVLMGIRCPTCGR